jgi:DNA-binding Xre family transcriptional regulator
MIKNEKQYKITKKKLLGIQEEIGHIRGDQDQVSLPEKEQLILVSLTMIQAQLEEELAAYDLLKTDPSAALTERTIEELPSLLIEYKIHSGLTQKAFARKIGMKEQQLQRYEAENFKSISFKNLLKILDTLGLNINIKATSVNKMTKNQPGKNNPIA